MQFCPVGSTNITVWALSTILALSLLGVSGPVAKALPVGPISGQDGTKRKLSKHMTSRLPSRTDPHVVSRRAITDPHQVYMKVLFPKGMTPTKVHSIDVTLHQKPATYIRRGTLYSKYTYLLQIKPDGTVEGTNNENSPYAELEFHSVGAGLHMILGVSTRRYLTITDKGVLTAESMPSLNSIFKEIYLENLFQSFLSYKHQKKGWYVALKKNGKAKKAMQTHMGQKSTQFMTSKNPVLSNSSADLQDIYPFSYTELLKSSHRGEGSGVQVGKNFLRMPLQNVQNQPISEGPIKWVPAEVTSWGGLGTRMEMSEQFLQRAQARQG